MKKNWTGERWETFVYNETALEHLHRYAVACELSANKNVLDIACGEGYGSRLLALNAASVTGVDIDATTINKAKEKYKAGHLRFITADARATTLPSGSFDRNIGTPGRPPAVFGRNQKTTQIRRTVNYIHTRYRTIFRKKRVLQPFS